MKTALDTAPPRYLIFYPIILLNSWAWIKPLSSFSLFDEFSFAETYSKMYPPSEAVYQEPLASGIRVFEPYIK